MAGAEVERNSGERACLDDDILATEVPKGVDVDQ